jgi:hypothetical protein
MVSEGFIGCTLGCLAGGAFEPNGAMLCLLSCYLVEIHGGSDGDDGDDNGDASDDNGETNDEDDGETNNGNNTGVSEGQGTSSSNADNDSA